MVQILNKWVYLERILNSIKSRYTSENLEKALEAQISPEALDEAKRIEIYHNYDKVFMEELPVIPQLNKMEYIVVNKRVKEYDWKYDIDMKEFDWSKIEVTAKRTLYQIQKN